MTQRFLPPSTNIQPDWILYRQRFLPPSTQTINGFTLGESGPLNTPYRPNFTLNGGNYNPKFLPSTDIRSNSIIPASATGQATKNAITAPKMGVGKGLGIAGLIGESYLPLFANWNAPGSNWQSRANDFIGGTGSLAGGILGYYGGGLVGHPYIGSALGSGAMQLIGSQTPFGAYNKAREARWANMTPEELANDAEFQAEVRRSFKPESRELLTPDNLALGQAKQQAKEQAQQQTNAEENLQQYIDSNRYMVDPYQTVYLGDDSSQAGKNLDKYIEMQNKKVNEAKQQLNAEGIQTVFNEQAKKELARELMDTPVDYSKGYTPSDIQYLQTLAEIARAQENRRYQDWVSDPLVRANVARGFGLNANEVWGKDVDPQTKLSNQLTILGKQYEMQKNAEERAQFLKDVGDIATMNGGAYIPPSFLNTNENRAKMMEKIIAPYQTEPVDLRMKDYDARNNLTKQEIQNLGNIFSRGVTGDYGNERAQIGGYYRTINANADRVLKADIATQNAMLRELDIASRSPKLTPEDRLIIEGVKAGAVPFEEGYQYITQKYNTGNEIQGKAGGGKKILMTPLNIDAGPDIPLTGAPSNRAAKYYK